MRILFIHNDYIKPSGEENASNELAHLLEEHGHEIRWFKKTSADIHGFMGKLKAFSHGIYSPSAAKELSVALDEFNPDVVQVQNLYPFISTSIFKPLRRRGVPVVMRCPNYRLFCPNGLCLDKKGQVCERCFGSGKEMWCMLKDCESNISKSIGYALRNSYARLSRNILDGVDMFIVQSEFQKAKFSAQGIDKDHIGIVPGISPTIDGNYNYQIGEWVSFVGRVSPEKGINEFIEAARICRNIQFKVAGNLDKSFKMPKYLPENVEFVGFLKGHDLNEFYMKSRIIVVPSKWYEGFPNVIVRGMLLGKPVITTNIGAMQSIIKTNWNGVLVPPSNVDQLASEIDSLFQNERKCRSLGEKGKKDALSKYSRETIYSILMDIYNKAIFYRSKC